MNRYDDDFPLTPETDSSGDETADSALRPKRLSDYVGQKRVVEQIGIFIKAAIMREEPLDHTLLFGPPGLGKTTLAVIIANEMGSKIVTTSGPALERAGDLVAILTGLDKGDVLFIDEIHRLPAIVEEVLYPAMEDRKIDILVGEGQSARTVTLPLEPFTLVGATTRSGMLTNPLRDRFGISARLDFYTNEELAQIVERSASILDCGIDSHGSSEIAKRSRGTPRIANRLLRRVRDFAQVMGDGIITKDLADQGLDMLEVDPLGLDHADRRLLSTIIDKFNGGPVGIDNLASAIGESKDTIENAIEPFLIQQGYLSRTSRGRVATETIKQHFFDTGEKNV